MGKETNLQMLQQQVYEKRKEEDMHGCCSIAQVSSSIGK
jgi:hypothetical protein